MCCDMPVIQEQDEEEPEFFNDVWFSDEAHLLLLGTSIARTMRIAEHKPYARCFKDPCTL